MTPGQHQVDLDHLLKLRLIVARYGEMDGAGWWNTKGVLSPKGATLMSRGFPKTHYFAQARLVFEVARTRSAERFPAVPGCITLWNVPAALEDEFDARWADWLESEAWSPFFEALQPGGDDLLAMLRDRDLITPEHEAEVSRLRRSAENRAVPLSGFRKVDDETITLLAAAFARGEHGNLAVPYARVSE